MRGTVFVVSRRFAPVVFAATRAATATSGRRWLGTHEHAYARLAPKVLAALAGQSLTVRELRKTLGADADLPGVVAMLCDEGRIVRNRPVGSRHSRTFRYRLWIDAFPGVLLDECDEDAATRELVRLYVDSYGPTDREDLIWWTGLPVRRIDEAIHRRDAELATVSVTGLGNRFLITGTALNHTEAIQPPAATAVNPLPKLDPYTMGFDPDHRDRRLILERQHWPRRSGSASQSPSRNTPQWCRSGSAAASCDNHSTGPSQGPPQAGRSQCPDPRRATAATDPNVPPVSNPACEEEVPDRVRHRPVERTAGRRSQLVPVRPRST